MYVKKIKSSYNVRNKCGFFLLDYKKIELKYLSEIIELNNTFAIIEQTDGAVDYSSDFHQITHNKLFPLVYRIQHYDFQRLEKLISEDKDANVLLVELSGNDSNDLFLENINDIDLIIGDCRISKCIIGINKFESEISILLKEINEEQFKKMKDNINNYKQN